LLEIEANGLVSFSVTTSNGTFKVSQPFVPGEWHIVQGTFNNNTVTISVDGGINQVASSGQIVLTSNSLTIGENFTGNINDVIFDRLFLVQIGGVDSNNQVNLGSSGQATITLTPQTDIPDYAKADFNVVAQSSNSGLFATVKMSAPGAQLAQKVDDAASNYSDKVMYVLGFLLPVDQVKDIVWQLGTLSGGGKANWRSVTKDSLLIILNFAGGEIVKGIGAGAKVLAGAWGKLFAASADSSLTLITENLLRKGCRAGDVDGAVGPFKDTLAYIKGLSVSEATDLAKIDFSELGFTELSRIHKAMGPLFIDTLIDIERTISAAAGKKLINVLGDLDEVILKDITDAEALKGLAKVLDKGVDCTTMSRVLKNTDLFNTTLPIIGKYSRNQLGKDFAAVAHVESGLVSLAKQLKAGGPGIKGYAYELRRGATLGSDLKAFDLQFAWKDGETIARSDLDLITYSGKNLQLKSGLIRDSKRTESYIKVCLEDKGIGNIHYEVPDLSTVPDFLTNLIEKYNALYPGKISISQWP
jgi:hypothetical protein